MPINAWHEMRSQQLRAASQTDLDHFTTVCSETSDYTRRTMKVAICLLLLVLASAIGGAAAKKQKGTEHGRRGHRKREALTRLANQLSKQQFYVEEQARAAGHSGIRVVRLRGEGTRPYHAASHSDDRLTASIHDHADFINTCGMAEVTASLNGVFFKTRHNDYLLVRRADHGAGYDDTETIPYPDVPPAVLGKSSVAEQMAEMRKYFEAFAKQDDSIRDYKPYFRAHLCYMQAAWTVSDPDEIQEPFFSMRHHYDASSWRELYERTRFESYSGKKNNLENFAFMPSTLWEVTEDGELVFGQWNYKILCHQLKDDLPLSRLRAVDDLKTRMTINVTYKQYSDRRNARFQVNPVDSDEWRDEPTRYGLLDELMEQIPGPDGYGAHLQDDAFGYVIKKFDAPPDDDEPLNVAYFHRWFQNERIGALGERVRHRGYNDENMWSAMTTQDRVLPIRIDYCPPEGDGRCQNWRQKWVYAIPLEIIYTTPLQTWNPYDIEYKGMKDQPLGRSVYDGPLGQGTRNGSDSLDLAYNGTNSATFYRTPWEFFSGPELTDDPADTPRDFVYVLGADGTDRYKVRPSGIRTFFPEIEGLGKIRQRYPIYPVYGEGSPVWKELDALKEIVLNPRKYHHMMRQD